MRLAINLMGYAMQSTSGTASTSVQSSMSRTPACRRRRRRRARWRQTFRRPRPPFGRPPRRRPMPTAIRPRRRRRAATFPRATQADATYTEEDFGLTVYDNLWGRPTCMDVYITKTGDNTLGGHRLQAKPTPQPMAGASRIRPPLSATRNLKFDSHDRRKLSSTTGSTGCPLHRPANEPQYRSRHKWHDPDRPRSGMTQLATDFSRDDGFSANGNAAEHPVEQGQDQTADGTVNAVYASGVPRSRPTRFRSPRSKARRINLTSLSGNVYQVSENVGSAGARDERRTARALGSINLRCELRAVDGRSRHRTHQHDPGSARVRGQFEGPAGGLGLARRTRSIDDELNRRTDFFCRPRRTRRGLSRE